MEAGHPGQSGQSVMHVVGGAGSDGHVVAPIQHHLMEVLFVRAHPFKESHATPSVQVKRTDTCQSLTHYYKHYNTHLCQMFAA